MDSQWSFWMAQQVARTRLRVLVVRAALVSCASGIVAMAIFARLLQAGLETAAMLLAALWVVALAPALLLHLAVCADVLLLCARGRPVAWPTVVAMLLAQQAAGAPPARPRRPAAVALTRLFSLAAHTSPLAALASWSIAVLLRAPESGPLYGRAARPSRAGLPPEPFVGPREQALSREVVAAFVGQFEARLRLA